MHSKGCLSCICCCSAEVEEEQVISTSTPEALEDHGAEKQSEGVTSTAPPESAEDTMKQREEVTSTASPESEEDTVKQREEVTSTSPAESQDDKVKAEREEVSNTRGETIGEGSQDDKVKHQEETSLPLPEELAEMIMARVPFPSLFKARLLSKSWRARLSPISSLDDDQEKCLAREFQRKVAQQSKNWTSFCPVITHTAPFGYDQGSQAWRKLPSLNFLPNIPLVNVLIEGALFVSYTISWSTSPSTCKLEVLVANMLTRRCKQLPLPPTEMQCTSFDILSHTKEAYKVISVHQPYRRGNGNSLVFVYDSTSGTWSLIQELPPSTVQGDSKRYGLTEYKDGVLYLVRTPFDVTTEVLAIDVVEEKLEVLNISLEESEIKGETVFGERQYCGAICRGNLAMVSRSTGSFQLVKFDVKLRQFVEVAQGVRGCGDHRASAGMFVNNGEDLFFQDGQFSQRATKDFESQVVAFNMREQEWRCFHYPPRSSPPIARFDDYYFARRPYWIESTFQPGLNPFAEV